VIEPSVVSQDAECYSRLELALWRNWQTQQTQNLPLFGASRFDSGEGHHLVLLHALGAARGHVVRWMAMSVEECTSGIESR
jgi:hypothetical protein